MIHVGVTVDRADKESDTESEASKNIQRGGAVCKHESPPQAPRAALKVDDQERRYQQQAGHPRPGPGSHRHLHNHHVVHSPAHQGTTAGPKVLRHRRRGSSSSATQGLNKSVLSARIVPAVAASSSSALPDSSAKSTDATRLVDSVCATPSATPPTSTTAGTSPSSPSTVGVAAIAGTATARSTTVDDGKEQVLHPKYKAAYDYYEHRRKLKQRRQELLKGRRPKRDDPGPFTASSASSASPGSASNAALAATASVRRCCRDATSFCTVL